MKKRGLLILLLVLIPNSLAILTEELYSGTVLNAQTVNISDTEFAFDVLNEINTVYISWEGSSFSISGYVEEANKTAETNCDEKEGFYFCVGKIAFSYTNTTTKTRYYSAPVKISAIITEVDMSRTIDNTDLLIGQQFTVNTIFENKGTIEAKNIEYTDYFPDAFSMNSEEVKGCNILGRNIVFNGAIGINEKKTCAYTLTALEGISYNSKAVLSYYNGRETKEEADEKTINIANYSIKIIKTINKSILNIGDDFLLNLEIKNTNTNTDITLALDIELPEKLKLKKRTSGLDQITPFRLKWKGEIPAGKSENISLAFKAEQFGNFNLKYNSKYKINDINREIKEDVALNIIKPELTINIDVPSEIEQEKESKIRVKIINKNKFSVSNINIRTENNLNLPNINKALSRLNSTDSFLVLDTDFIAPAVDTDSIFYYNLTLTYKLENGQNVITKKSIPLEVKAYKEQGTIVRYGEENPQETKQEKKAALYEEAQQVADNLYSSIFIKIMFLIIILFLLFLILRFRGKIKKQETNLKEPNVEETKTDEKEAPKTIKEPEIQKPSEEDLEVPEPPKSG